MIKRACDCDSCRARDAADFDRIVEANPGLEEDLRRVWLNPDRPVNRVLTYLAQTRASGATRFEGGPA